MKKFLILLLAILALSSLLFISSCGETENVDETIDICPDGRHEFSVWKILQEATCTEYGLQERNCLICKQYKEQQRFSNSTNHDYQGYICTRCGDSIAPFETKFVLSDDGTYYILNSIDVTDDAREEDNSYTVPSEHLGLPVKEIASKALKNCDTLETVIIPDTIEKIGEGALMGCRKIKYLTIPFVGSDTEGTIPYFGHIFGVPDTTAGMQPISQGKEETYKKYYISPVLTKITVTGGELLEGCFENCETIKAVEYTGTAEIVHNNAFMNCISLDKFTFPITLCEFGDYAFYRCIELDVFPLYEGVEKIGEYCFAGVNTDYLSIPSTLQSVGSYAFADCNFIENIIIPANVERLSIGMFEGCSALKTVTLEESAGSSYKIKSIGRYCFNGCELLETVKIAGTVEEIREGAFHRCVSLKTINFPSSIKSIDTNAFSYCTALEEVSLANGIKVIKTSTFEHCDSLKTVKLPSSVEDIEQDAFLHCPSLENFEINKANSFFSSENGHIYSAGMQSLKLVAPGFKEEVLTIPEGVVSIESGAFTNATSIKSVVFPSTLKLINEEAFYQHPSISSVTINANMQKIGKNAFAGCPLLESVEITGVSTIDKSAFTQCKKLKTVTIDSVESILDSAFYLCTELTTVSLTNVGLVGDTSFKNCSKLSELTFGENVLVIGTEAFSFCDSLKTVAIGEGNNTIGDFAFRSCTKLETVTVAKGCVTVGEAAFELCTSLVEVDLPKTLESINAYAFQYCTALKNIHITAGGKYAVTRNSFIVEINAETQERTLIIVTPGAITEEITIPNNIHAIAPMLFRHVTVLKKVNFPDSLKTIGNEAFFDTGLTEIDLKNVETIGAYAFGQTKLTSVTITESVVSIGKYAFQFCKDLKEIYIRANVNSIGQTLFHDVGTEENPLKIYLEFENEDKLPLKWSIDWLKGCFAEIIYGYVFE